MKRRSCGVLRTATAVAMVGAFTAPAALAEAGGDGARLFEAVAERGVSGSSAGWAVQGASALADGLSTQSAGAARRTGPFAGLQLAQAATEKPQAGGAGVSGSDSFRLGGFYQGTFAYTYADPTHWSRAVQRFQLSAEGKLGDRVKYKIGGRVDVDPVYYGSDFYLDDVKRDQRFSAIWGENYLDFEAAGWDFRLGAQHIIWGEVVGLFFADVVSARDTRDFLLPTFDVIRIPQWAVRAEHFWGDSHVEFVWIPVATYDRIGKPGSDFYPAPLQSPTPESVAALFQDPSTPSRTLANSNYGVRANTLVGGWDIAGFYYRSYAAQPTFYRYPTGVAGQPFVFQPQPDRIWQAGATVSKDFDSFVLRGEAVYTSGQGFAVADLTAPESVVKRNYFDYIVSVEWPIGADTRLNVQAFQRIFSGSGESNFAIKTDGFGASVLLAHKLTPEWEPQILWIQNFQDTGGLVRPRVNWTPARNTNVAFGVDIFTGPSDGYFGRYNNRDRAYVEVRYDF